MGDFNMRQCEKNGHAVVIAGGGPTGLMLAAELALAGIDVAIVERRVNQDVVGWRSGGLHARTIEIFDQRGIADRFLSRGQVVQITGFGWIRLDMSDFPSRYPHGLALKQSQGESILAEWVGELKVPIYRGREVTSFTQDDSGVDIELSDGQSLHAAYLVGCDGGRSRIRKTAGIDFPGWAPTTRYLLAEVEVSEEPKWGLRRDETGIHGFSRPEEGPVRIMVTEQNSDKKGEPTLQDLREALIAIYGSDYGVHSPISLSRFTDVTRQAATYRSGRVLLAGDAAHVHPPIGGQGMQIGIQDAVNLGWKLAQVVKGISPVSLLDTYHAERHPVAARVLHNTMAQTALLRYDDRNEALRDTMTELLAMDGPRKRIAAMMSGMDIHYDFGKGHPLLGRRMPDLDLLTVNGPLQLYSLLHQARPLLLNLNEPQGFDITPWINRMQVVEATYTGKWELPVLGIVSAPTAVLVRPDGHVAWVGEQSQHRLTEALTTWFGRPAAI